MDQSVSEPFLFVVPDQVEAGRADKVLASQFPELSRNRIRMALDSGLIAVGSKILNRRDTLRGGEELTIRWLRDPDFSASPVEFPLTVIFEDEHVIAIEKPAGMVTHPGHGTIEPTLVHALLHHTGGRLSPVGGPERPGIVHRLDKETSGVIVAAKTELAHHRLAQQFSSRSNRKEYLAWVLGEPETESGSIVEPIGRHPVHRTKMQVQRGGRSAHTDWKISTRTARGAALLECRIHTGRTHQIRVHLASIGHPLLGDATYGYKPRGRPWEPVPRVMLHARLLELDHPVSGVRLCLEAAIPDDFARFGDFFGAPGSAS